VTKPDYVKQMAHPNRCAISSDEFWMKNGFFYSFNVEPTGLRGFLRRPG
jgi:hypothetical protein